MIHSRSNFSAVVNNTIMVVGGFRRSGGTLRMRRGRCVVRLSFMTLSRWSALRAVKVENFYGLRLDKEGGGDKFLELLKIY